MEREYFVHAFAERLTALLKQAHLTSSVSKAGVRISQLADACGCSSQMARRYVLGEALPEIDVTYKIAKWLNVSAGWLLFGEETAIPQNPNLEKKPFIKVEPDVLEYILKRSFSLLDLTPDTNDLVQFILDSINDTMHIQADKKEIMKVIDISVNSARRFHGIKKNGKIKTPE